jgi:predicted MPP superfamily phosphohydrolase
VKGNEPVTIVPIGDMHVGNIGFDKKYFQDMVDWICEEKNCYTIGMGDFADSIIHLDADRYDVNCVDTEFNTIEKQYRYVSKWLGKLAKKDKLLAILTGNHEYTIEHKYGHEICNRLAYDLGVKNLGVQGMIRLVLQENYDTKKNKSHAYTMFCHHGCGAGRKTGSVVNRIEEFAEAYDADLFAMGHTHRKFGSIQARWKISDQKDGDGNLTLREHKVAFINTGTFLNTFVVGGPSTYAERAGYNPTVKGVMKAILSLDGDIHVRE